MSAGHNKPRQLAQDNAHAMWAFAEQEPDWMERGLMVINAWGREEGILQHLVALAIKDAYERGCQGRDPSPLRVAPPAQKMFKRSVHTPAPPPEPEVTLPELSAPVAAALRQAGFDPTVKTTPDLRRFLRKRGHNEDAIFSATLHWTDKP